MSEKRCAKCGEIKPLSAFPTSYGKPHGACKACKYAAQRERYHSDPEFRERVKGHAAKRRAEKPDVIKAEKVEWSKTRRGKRNEAFTPAVADANERWRLAHPEEHYARSCVNYAVKMGKLPPVKTLTCVDCGAPARDYHHHLGYAVEHVLDVVALCRICHRARHA